MPRNPISEQEMTVRIGAIKDEAVLFWTDIPFWMRRLEAAGATVERRGEMPGGEGLRSLWARLPANRVKLVLLTEKQAQKRSQDATKKAIKLDLAAKMRAKKASEKASQVPEVGH